MSYTPTEWKAGDTVTSAKLNKIEQGIANASGTSNNEESLAFIVTYDEELGHTDKTFTQIKDAWLNGKQVLLKYNVFEETRYDLSILKSLRVNEDNPSVNFDGGLLVTNGIDEYLFFTD